MDGNIQKVDGRWRIDYCDAEGERHRETFQERRRSGPILDYLRKNERRLGQPSVGYWSSWAAWNRTTAAVANQGRVVNR